MKLVKVEIHDNIIAVKERLRWYQMVGFDVSLSHHTASIGEDKIILVSQHDEERAYQKIIGFRPQEFAFRCMPKPRLFMECKIKAQPQGIITYNDEVVFYGSPSLGSFEDSNDKETPPTEGI